MNVDKNLELSLAIDSCCDQSIYFQCKSGHVDLSRCCILLEQVTATPGALFVEEKPASANDSWRKLHSDPLFLIRQQEQAAIARIKSNPVKMAEIKKDVVIHPPVLEGPIREMTQKYFFVDAPHSV